MQTLTAHAAAEALLAADGPALTADRPVQLRYEESHTVIRVEVPAESFRAVSLAYVVLMSDVPTDDEPDFAGASVWMRDWDVWGEASDRVGVTLLSGIREGCGIKESVQETPVMAFGASEIARTHSVLTLALLFQWDAYYLPASRRFLAFASHDGYVEVTAANTTVLQRLHDRFSRGGWSPSLQSP